MKKLMLRKALVLVALLASSAGMAAQVTITSDDYSVVQGQTFTLTLAGDLNNVFAATIDLSFDPNRVAYVSGIGLGSFTVFIKNSPAATTPTDFYFEIPAGSLSGQQNYAQLTFQVLANAAAGWTGIVFSDDGGGNSGWPDFTTNEPIIPTYSQANVQVVTPIPAAVWLFGSALGVMGVMRRKFTS